MTSTNTLDSGIIKIITCQLKKKLLAFLNHLLIESLDDIARLHGLGIWPNGQDIVIKFVTLASRAVDRVAGQVINPGRILLADGDGNVDEIARSAGIKLRGPLNR